MSIFYCFRSWITLICVLFIDYNGMETMMQNCWSEIFNFNTFKTFFFSLKNFFFYFFIFQIHQINFQTFDFPRLIKKPTHRKNAPTPPRRCALCVRSDGKEWKFPSLRGTFFSMSRKIAAVKITYVREGTCELFHSVSCSWKINLEPTFALLCARKESSG